MLVTELGVFYRVKRCPTVMSSISTQRRSGIADDGLERMRENGHTLAISCCRRLRRRRRRGADIHSVRPTGASGVYTELSRRPSATESCSIS